MEARARGGHGGGGGPSVRGVLPTGNDWSLGALLKNPGGHVVAPGPTHRQASSSG